MLDQFKILIQYLLPKQALTQFAGCLAEKKLGFFTTWMIKLFIKLYDINMQEAQLSQAEDYLTFNDFFIRQLKEGARPLATEPDHLVYPADGKISQIGSINNGELIQAKGHTYGLDSLLACNSPLVSIFENGTFMTTYLSPQDYHRVHMPCRGVLKEMIYVPGSLFSVNLVTSEHIPNLFARNERVICIFETEFGTMAQILVGATIVGSISTVWHGVITPPRQGILQRWNYPLEGEQRIVLERGEEMGYFKLGSTVINLFMEDRITFIPSTQIGATTRTGSAFATTEEPT